MENTYLTALHGLEGMFEYKDEVLKGFHKNEYKGSFQEFYRSNLAVFQALEEGYVNAIEKEVFLSNMAEALTKAAAKKLDGANKKREIENAKIDLNLVMVAYILPAIAKYSGSSKEAMIAMTLKKWKEQFPESNIQAGSFEDIESGFHKKWCFITTAVCENFGRSDDCYELTLLRDYRDHYLASLENGEELIKEYYDVAPTIVKRINKKENRDQIYSGIWESYIKPCIALIEEDRNADCRDLYTKMVRNLEEEYFYSH